MERLERSIADARPERHPSAEAARGAAACLAEALGAFALTTVAAGGEMVARMGLAGADHVARAVAPGLLVAAFIYALGDASGAHFNPAVTLAFALKRMFPWPRVPAYWASQLAGAIVAAVVLRLVLGDVGDLGATAPHVPTGAAVAVEIILSWTLVTVVLGTADRYRLIGPDAALAVGATIALCGLWAGPLEGASMNPARSLGPAIVGGQVADAWIYVVGPLIGAGLAVLTTLVLHGTGTRHPEQLEAAQGRQARDGQRTDEGDTRDPHAQDDAARERSGRSRRRSGAQA